MAKIDSVYDFSDKALVELKSWLQPWFRDKCRCQADISGGPGLADLIAAVGPDAFWKLNESSGTTAHDSSGNGHDLTPPGGSSPPVWGQPAGPPGETSAEWLTNANRVVGTLPAYGNNFTAGVWTKPGSGSELMGQGTAFHGGGGWELMAPVSSPLSLLVAGVPLNGDTTLNPAAWYFVAVVRAAGTWKLYVDGVQQSATSTTAPSAPATDTWLGNDGYASHTSYLQNGFLSYAFIVNHVLTAGELLALHDAGGGGLLPTDRVWTSDGAGAASWQRPTIGASGTTAVRPTVTVVGTGFWDTTLGKPIWWNGTVWKDATGTTV